jgi:hypothetical protein
MGDPVERARGSPRHRRISDKPFFTTGVGERDDFLYFSYATLTTVGYET